MLLQQRPRGQRRRRRFVLAALLILLAAGWLGFPATRRWYERHRTFQAVARARQSFAAGDTDRALLAIRVAAPSPWFDQSGVRLMAAILESAGKPEAVAARLQVLQLGPPGLEDQLACVRTAVRFGELATAERVFSGLGAAERERPESQHVLAALRFAQHRPIDAEAALAQALAPGAPSTASGVELSLVRLRSSRADVHDPARSTLVAALPTAGNARPLLLRELLRDAVARRDVPAVHAYADALGAESGATFEDRLRRLNAERAWPRLGAVKLLSETRALAAQTPANAAAFARWMTANDRPGATLEWIRQLPPEIRSAVAVRAARADALAAERQWDDFATELAAGAWGPVQPETVAAALSAKRLADTHRNDAALAAWTATVAANLYRRDDLRMLVRLADRWSLPGERRVTLDRLSRQYPDEVWALEQLAIDAFGRRDTIALNEIWARWMRARPQDRRAQCDWVMTSLLRVSTVPAREVIAAAENLHGSDPANPFFTTALAFCRWRQNDAAAGLALMEHLPADVRRQPNRAVYYGALLAAVGDAPTATTILAAADPRSLLPEELELLAAARREIAARARMPGDRNPR